MDIDKEDKMENGLIMEFTFRSFPLAVTVTTMVNKSSNSS